MEHRVYDDMMMTTTTWHVWREQMERKLTVAACDVVAEWSVWLVEKGSLKANGRGWCLSKERFPVACCSIKFRWLTSVSTAVHPYWMIGGYWPPHTASPRLTSGPLSFTSCYTAHCMTGCKRAMLRGISARLSVHHTHDLLWLLERTYIVFTVFTFPGKVFTLPENIPVSIFPS